MPTRFFASQSIYDYLSRNLTEFTELGRVLPRTDPGSNTTCLEFHVDPDLALLFHYRKDCVGRVNATFCEKMKHDLVRDEAVLRYKDELEERVASVISNVNT